MSRPADRTTDPGSKVQVLGWVAFFAMVAGLRFWTSLLSPEPLGDELIYLKAIVLAAEGQSPYQGGYFYPPLFALAGAALWQLGGDPLILVLLRLANTFGLAALLTASLWFWRSGSAQRAWIGVGVILLSPAVALGMEWGNLSLWAAGVTVPAVLGFRRYPWVSGIALAAVVAIKPLAAVAVAVVLVDRWCLLKPWRRPWTKESIREWLLVATLALTQGVALALGARYLQDFLAQRAGWPEATRSVSVHRLFYLAGLELDALAIFVVVTLSAVVLVVGTHRYRSSSPGRGEALDRTELLGVAVVASLLATPLVWAHTLLLALPVQVLAVRRLMERRSPDHGLESEPHHGGLGGRSRIYEATGVVLAILACHWVEGTGGIDDRSALVQAVVQILPAISTPLLLLYLFRADSKSHLDQMKRLSELESAES